MTDTIPLALRERPQWVLWRDEHGRKVPYSISGEKASSTNPATWATYEEVRSVERQGRHSGIGFVFTPDDPFAGIDLDDCREQDTNTAWAQSIVDETASYAEVSPSGHGIKIWVLGTLPDNVKTKHIELYHKARYFTVTGRRLEQAPSDIKPAQSTLDRLYAQLRPNPAPPPDPVPIAATPPDAYLHKWAQKTIAQEVARVMGAADGEKHNTRFNAARLLGGLIPLGLATAQEIENALYGAQPPKTATARDERKTIRDGITSGTQTPLKPPEPPRQPLFDNVGWACCPEHETRLEPAKNGNGWHCVVYNCFWWEGEGYIPPEHVDPSLPFGLKIGSKAKAGPTPTPPSIDWLQRGISAFALQGREFDQINWPVANILSEGCTLLAGKPKSKKSWLALAIAVDVALGRTTLGGLETKQSRVVYLDLESNQRRMQSRLRALLGNDPWPDNLHIFTEWPRGELAIQQLDIFKAAYPDVGLVIGDILQNLRPVRVKNANPYDEDYEAVKPFNEWGERNHAGVLVLHHTRKAKADDVFDEISGSTGLLAGVAAMWVIGRMANSSESVLAIRGRDIVFDDDMALSWDDYTCRFVLAGSAEERSMSEERRAVLDIMDDTEEYTPKELASLLGKPVNSVVKLLTHLFADRMIEKTGRGRYVKVMGRQTYGLIVKSGTSGTSSTTGTTGTTGTSADKVDSATISNPYEVPACARLCPPDSTSGHNDFDASQSIKQGANNGIVPVVPTILPNEEKLQSSGHDHDKRRQLDIDRALARNDYKSARRAAHAMRGNVERKRAEERIDEVERERKKDGGYRKVDGY